jgi:hypothetical protein
LGGWEFEKLLPCKEAETLKTGFVDDSDVNYRVDLRILLKYTSKKNGKKNWWQAGRKQIRHISVRHVRAKVYADSTRINR